MDEPNFAPKDPNEGLRAAEAAEHIAGAHEQLKTLRDRLGILNRHPELEEALTKLEMALNTLTISTGGML